MWGIFTLRWDVGVTGRSAVALQQLEQKDQPYYVSY